MNWSAVKPWIQRLLKAVRILLTLLFALLLSLVGWVYWTSIPPKQAELIERFHESRAEYEQLRQMIVEDQLAMVGDYGEAFARQPYQWQSASEIGVPDERQKTYASLMTRTDTKRMDRLEDGSVNVSMAGWGFASSGWRLNLVWSSTDRSPKVLTVDDFRRTKDEWEEAYSHVEGNWYLRVIVIE